MVTAEEAVPSGRSSSQAPRRRVWAVKTAVGPRTSSVVGISHTGWGVRPGRSWCGGGSARSFSPVVYVSLGGTAFAGEVSGARSTCIHSTPRTLSIMCEHVTSIL